MARNAKKTIPADENPVTVGKDDPRSTGKKRATAGPESALSIKKKAAASKTAEQSADTSNDSDRHKTEVDKKTKKAGARRTGREFVTPQTEDNPLRRDVHEEKKEDNAQRNAADGYQASENSCYIKRDTPHSEAISSDIFSRFSDHNENSGPENKSDDTADFRLLSENRTAQKEKTLLQTGPTAISESVPPVSFPENEKKNFVSRVLLLLAVSAVIVLSVLIFLYRPDSYDERTNSVAFLYSPEQNTTAISVNGTVRETVSGTLQERAYASRGKVCVARIGDTLYRIKGRKVTRIADGTLDFVLSAEGNAVAYRTAPGNLFHLMFNKDESHLISQTTYDSYYCLSPDGRDLCYRRQMEDGTVRLDVESGSGSAPYLTHVTDLVPVAISDHCRYLYYIDADGALYVLDNKADIRTKCGTLPDLSTLIFNRDFSELCFKEQNGGTVFFGAGKRRTVTGVSADDVLSIVPNQRAQIRELTFGRQLMTSTFSKNYYLLLSGTGKRLVFLNRRWTFADISFVDGPESVTVTDKAVYFLLTDQLGTESHSNLYRSAFGKTEKDRLSWDVKRYAANVDGSRILYTDSRGALYAMRIGAVPKRLCDMVQDGTLCVTADDVFYFYRNDGMLCLSENGGELHEVRQETQGVFTDGHAVYYTANKAPDGYFDVYVNYRNHRKDTLLGNGILPIQ